MSRLFEQYENEIAPRLQERFGYKNRLAVPRLEKIVVNSGVGRATENADVLEDAIKQFSIITGQRPKVTRARKSVAGFRLRKGNRIGCVVTLRGRRMYEFLDRLISLALPRVRDFRGLKRTAFDGRGNYSLGLADITVFPEIDLDDIQFTHGMDITIVTTAKTDEEAFELLSGFGMPFART